MRIVSGFARGKKLSAPQGLDVRPTIDRVKEAVFSSLQFDIEGRSVLDLFAGSGQLGLEAVSRGAKECNFVDSNGQRNYRLRARKQGGKRTEDQGDAGCTACQNSADPPQRDLYRLRYQGG